MKYIVLDCEVLEQELEKKSIELGLDNKKQEFLSYFESLNNKLL